MTSSDIENASESTQALQAEALSWDADNVHSFLYHAEEANNRLSALRDRLQTEIYFLESSEVVSAKALQTRLENINTQLVIEQQKKKELENFAKELNSKLSLEVAASVSQSPDRHSLRKTKSRSGSVSSTSLVQAFGAYSQAKKLEAYVNVINTVQSHLESIQTKLTLRDWAALSKDLGAIVRIERGLRTESACKRLSDYVTQCLMTNVDYLASPTVVPHLFAEMLEAIILSKSHNSTNNAGIDLSVTGAASKADGQQFMEPEKELLELLPLFIMVTEVTRPSDSNSGQVAIKQRELISSLLAPFASRFRYHFAENRRTDAIDKPKWFYTQILSWISSHQEFIAHDVQQVVNKTLTNLNFAALDSSKSIDNSQQNGYSNIFNDWITGLCGLVISRLQQDSTKIGTDPKLFAHLIDESVLFECELQAPPIYYPCSAAGVLEFWTETPNLLRTWIRIEHVCNMELVDQLITSQTAWSGRYQEASDIDEFKVPECVDEFIVLVQLMTERYKLLRSSVARLKFLSLQQQLLDDFRIRLVQLTRNLESAWSIRFCQIANASAYVGYVLKQWNDLPFFVMLQSQNIAAAAEEKPSDEKINNNNKNKNENNEKRGREGKPVKNAPNDTDVFEMDRDATPSSDPGTNSEMKLRKISQDSAFDPSADTAGVFDGLIELYEHLLKEMLQTMIVDILIPQLQNELRGYRSEKRYTSAKESNAASQPTRITYSFCAFLLTLRDRLSFISDHLSDELRIRCLSVLVTQIRSLLVDGVILNVHFSEAGAAQLRYDVTAGLYPLMDSFLLPTNDPDPKAEPSNRAREATSEQARIQHTLRSELDECLAILSLSTGTLMLLRGTLASAVSGLDDADSLASADAGVLATIAADFGIENISYGKFKQILSQRVDVPRLTE